MFRHERNRHPASVKHAVPVCAMAMGNLGLWESGSGLLLGVLNSLAIAESEALDELAEALGATRPTPKKAAPLPASASMDIGPRHRADQEPVRC